MVTDGDTIRTYFAKLGLEPEVADIYLALYSHGPQTISELSRSSKVERTRIYRLIDHLMASNLIEVESQYKRGIIKAAPIANLRILINEKEQELKSLQDDLGLIEQVLARNSLSNPSTRVQFYRGAEGIRQLTWNKLRAKGELIGCAYHITDDATGNNFMHKWAREFEARGLRKKLLVNDEYGESWAARKPLGKRIAGFEYNYLDPSIFKITNICDVYNDVTTFFQRKDNEIFGIEIYNQDIADMHRQFFEILWSKSTPEKRF